MLNMTSRVCFALVLLMVVFSGCLVEPEMPSEQIKRTPAGTSDSLPGPVGPDRPPLDTLQTPAPGGGVERPPGRDVPQPGDEEDPPFDDDPPSDGPLGLLADMTAMGTLYSANDNWWNIEVENAPVDPGSGDIIATIESYESSKGRLQPDFTPKFGIPYCVVDSETPLVPVVFNRSRAESDTGAPGAPAGYPIPAAAINDKRFIESGGALSGDRHLLIFDRDRRTVFELSYVEHKNGKWTAGYGAVFPVDSNYRRTEGWTSTDAAGLCVLAGLVRYDEVYGPEPIRHAIRCSIKRTDGYVWPASHAGASDDNAPPLGMRLRLKKSTNLSGYSPALQKIFQAMKTYGLIVADRGGNMYVQGTMDARWKNSELNPAFHSLEASDFEVIKLGWTP